MEFLGFASNVGRALLNAFTKDTEVFTLGVAGILSGAPVRLLRGLGRALLLYSVLRRLDQYVDVLIGVLTHNRQT